MYIKPLIDSGKTVFSLDDLRLLWRIDNPSYLKTVTGRLFRRGEIKRISHGLYVLNDRFDILELANKIKFPSYVSLETVLRNAGVVFQDTGNTIFSVSNDSLSREVAGHAFVYATLRDTILSNPLGIEHREMAMIATPERALCDRLYLSPNTSFDNVRALDPKKLLALSTLYNARTEQEIKNIIHAIKRHVER